MASADEAADFLPVMTLLEHFVHLFCSVKEKPSPRTDASAARGPGRATPGVTPSDLHAPRTRRGLPRTGRLCTSARSPPRRVCHLVSRDARLDASCPVLWRPRWEGETPPRADSVFESMLLPRLHRCDRPRAGLSCHSPSADTVARQNTFPSFLSSRPRV